MKVMVVGGAGYIGAMVAHRLRERGDRVWVFDNLSTGHREFIPRGARFLEGDLRDGAEIRAAMKTAKADAVMHFAASALVGESVEKPLHYYENNVLSCIQLLKAMQAAHCRAIIFSSTCAVFGEPRRIPLREDDPREPVNPYGRSKLMIEHILEDEARATDLRFVALRYFNAAGAHESGALGERHNPETHLIPNILKTVTGERERLTIFGDDYPTPDGTCIRDYVHIDDLASAHILSLDALARGMKSEYFNLGSGRGTSVKRLVKAAERVTGRKIPFAVGPRRAGDPARLVASSQKAWRVLRWKPRHDIESILGSAWAWERRE